jgi:hypothetical protein
VEFGAVRALVASHCYGEDCRDTWRPLALLADEHRMSEAESEI